MLSVGWNMLTGEGGYLEELELLRQGIIVLFGFGLEDPNDPSIEDNEGVLSPLLNVPPQTEVTQMF